MSNSQFDHVSVIKKANVYFDGRCISHNLVFPDQTRKTIGVIMPGTLNFGTDSPEVMEILEGKCRARIGSDGDWKQYEGGQQFRVPARTSFEIEVSEPVHYVCHFASQ
jgi:purine/pyrimidine-nucleoside phosphorylase